MFDPSNDRVRFFSSGSGTEVTDKPQKVKGDLPPPGAAEQKATGPTLPPETPLGEDGDNGHKTNSDQLPDVSQKSHSVSGEQLEDDGEGNKNTSLDEESAGMSGEGGKETAEKDRGSSTNASTACREDDEHGGIEGEDSESEEWIDYSTLSNIRLMRGPSVHELEKRKNAIIKWNSLGSGRKGNGDSEGTATETAAPAMETPKGKQKQGASGKKGTASPKSSGWKRKGKGKVRSTLAIGGLARIMAEASGKGSSGGVAK